MPRILSTPVNPMPTNWDLGFTAPHRLMAAEFPFLWNGEWCIYVWNAEKGDFEYYNYKRDTFHDSLKEM